MYINPRLAKDILDYFKKEVKKHGPNTDKKTPFMYFWPDAYFLKNYKAITCNNCNLNNLAINITKVATISTHRLQSYLWWDDKSIEIIKKSNIAYKDVLPKRATSSVISE